MTFEYRSLDRPRHEIRLLALRPAPRIDAPLRIRLTVVDLDDDSIVPPVYEAISYTWGQLEGVKKVWVEVHDDDGDNRRPTHELPYILVTPNLDAAMRHLRFRSADRVLWVDALCIDQSSTYERSCQVQQMRRIYERCTADLAWLGPEPSPPPPVGEDMETTEEEIRLQAELADRLRGGLQLMRHLAGRDVQTLSTMLERWDLSMSDEDYDDDEAGQGDGKMGWILNTVQVRQMRAAFSRASLWSRIWIVQELSCAPRVLLVVGREEAEGEAGTETEVHPETHPETQPETDHVLSLDWDADVVGGFLDDPGYADAFHVFWGHGQSGPLIRHIFSHARAVQLQRSLTRRSRRGNNDDNDKDSPVGSRLIDVLARFKDAQSSDPRDKVYGLLGLVAEKADLPPVDYTRTAAEVFGDAALAIIHASGCLDVFCQSPFQGAEDDEDDDPDRQSVRVPGLPSWAPNFDAYVYDDYADEFASLLFAQRGVFAAGRPDCRHLLPLETPADRDYPPGSQRRRRLKLCGTVLGRIAPLRLGAWSEPGRHGLSRPQILATVRQWADLYLGGDDDNASKAVYAPTGEPALHAFWRTVVADCTAYPIRRLTDDEAADCVRSWAAVCRLRDEELGLDPAGQADQADRANRAALQAASASLRRPDTPAESLLASSVSCAAMLPRMLRRWAFAQTDTGLFLMVRAAAQAGHVVAVLDGGKVPVVLEANDSDSDSTYTYRFVGTAYVHGCMDGQVVAQVEKGERAEQDIVLV